MRKSIYLFLCKSFAAINALALFWCSAWAATADDLQDVLSRGELRHLGVPYANFVTGSGDGLDMELMQRFAKHLGVRYRFVETSWADAIGDLTGKQVKRTKGSTEVVGEVPVRGDVIANGMTVLDWRKEVVAFGATTFPTQVWLVARANSSIRPIRLGNTLADDIDKTLGLVSNQTVLGKTETCLDPRLYDIDGHGGRGRAFQGSLNELVPAVINGEADLTLLDVPSALIELEKWPGQIKVIGPISKVQDMAPAFRPDSVALKNAFDRFFAELEGSGAWAEMARHYYPFVDSYFPDFLQESSQRPEGAEGLQ